MNTNYPLGLNLFVDNTSEDRLCQITTSRKTGNLFGTFSTKRTASYHSVFGKIITASGVMPQQFLLPDVTDYIQRDADVSPIPGTDDVAAIWSSNALNNIYQIYLKSYRVNNNGSVLPLGVSNIISLQAGNYVAPKIIYNDATKLYLVMWASVADKAIQYLMLSYDPDSSSFSASSYMGTINDVSSYYYSNSLVLNNETGTSTSSVNISLINAGDKIIATLRKDSDTLGFYEFGVPVSGRIPVTNLPDYEVKNILYFHTAYDEIKNEIKLVYNHSGDNHIYGVSVSYFGTERRMLVNTPVILNTISDRCYRAFIKPSPVIENSSGGEVVFYVAWETSSHGVFFNEFDSDLIPQQVEKEINPGVSSTAKPRITVTDSQICILVEAGRIGSESLNSTSILTYVEER